MLVSAFLTTLVRIFPGLTRIVTVSEVRRGVGGWTRLAAAWLAESSIFALLDIIELMALVGFAMATGVGREIELGVGRGNLLVPADVTVLVTNVSRTLAAWGNDANILFALTLGFTFCGHCSAPFRED